MTHPTKLMATPLGYPRLSHTTELLPGLSEVIAAEQRADIGLIGRIVAHLNFGGLHND